MSYHQILSINLFSLFLGQMKIHQIKEDLFQTRIFPFVQMLFFYFIPLVTSSLKAFVRSSCYSENRANSSKYYMLRWVCKITSIFECNFSCCIKQKRIHPVYLFYEAHQYFSSVARLMAALRTSCKPICFV